MSLPPPGFPSSPVPPPVSRRRGAPPWIPALLAGLTFLTCAVAGGLLSREGVIALERLVTGPLAEGPVRFLQLVVAGLPYAVALMGFFLAHEGGHWLACRIYGVDASPPWFIPAPTLIGTFGAVIRIRGPIPHRRALFDIGIAGPLSGFAVALPVLALGILRSDVVPATPPAPGTILFGDSLLTRLLIAWLRPEALRGDLVADPLFIAGWVGLLATAMNLVPAGQFDGGHVLYALFPRAHRTVSLGTATFLSSLVAFRWILHGRISAWIVWAGVTWLLGRNHPPVPWWPARLGRGRILLAWLALAILVLCFMPDPVDVF